MKFNEVWPDIFDEEYIHQFQPRPRHKIPQQSPSLKQLSNNLGDHPNLHENSHKLYNEMGHLILSLKNSQWKLRKKHDLNFPTEGKVLQSKD